MLVRREKAQDTTTGGLFIPEQAKLKSRTGEVLAVGPGAFLTDGSRRPMSVKPGEVVYFSGRVGQEVRVGDEDLVLLREDEIEGVVER